MERQAGRISRLMGALLVAFGALTMTALINPAAADPGNGHAYGHYKDDRSTVTFPDRTPPPTDPQAADPEAGNGANQSCGAYCPTGVGLPSGNGDGNAVGQPCAGCVGNADGKNPPGQFKDGGDPNNGYECDGNNGIGKTNPAHSGCHTTTTMPGTTTTVPKTTTTTAAPCTTSGCPTTTTTEPGSTTTTTPCSGQSCPTTTTVAPCTGDNCGTTTTTLGTNVLGENFSRPNDPGSPSTASTGPLAFTGGAIGRLLAIGLAIALMGLVIMAHRAKGVLARED